MIEHCEAKKIYEPRNSFIFRREVFVNLSRGSMENILTENVTNWFWFVRGPGREGSTAGD